MVAALLHLGARLVEFFSWLAQLPAAAVGLIAASFATLGWVYILRRNRALSRKQHTFNALLQVSFNPLYHEHMATIRQFVVSGELPEILKDEHAKERRSLQFVLNHYEFIAAGFRNGDISERLLRDSERGTIVRLFQVSGKYVASVRDERARRVTYEHLEWLYVRWHERKPTLWQEIVEWIIQRPLYHDSYKWIALGIIAGALLVIIIIALHMPGAMFNPQTLSPPHT